LGTITAAGLTDRGRIRKKNEDHWFADPERGLFIVSDGMGGHVGGELASKIVVEVLSSLLKTRLEGFQDLSEPHVAKYILKTLAEFNEHFRDESNKHANIAGMGATVVLVLVRNAHALISYMGDSRAYLLRKSSLERLTRDHSIVQILVDTGELTPKQAATYPGRSQITRYVGMDGKALPEARLITLHPGDRLLLCSDGLTGMLTDLVITRLLLKHFNPEDACRALILAANAAGGHDNITAVIIDWHGND
jgi:protein phosphatase